MTIDAPHARRPAPARRATAGAFVRVAALAFAAALLCAPQAWAQTRPAKHPKPAPHPREAAHAASTKPKTVTIASLGTVDPWRWVEGNDSLEKTTGYRIVVRRFGDSGAVVRAMAAGDIDIAELGSAGIATAVSEGMDYQLFWILEDIASAEALVARNGSGITDLAGLKGHKVATPFVSTSHYQLLFALDRAGIAPSDVTLVNLHPDEIAKAWNKGTIDAAFVWDPVLATLTSSGRTLVTSGDLCAEGACTFDGLVVAPTFAKANPAFMIGLVKLVAAADADYRAHPGSWGGDSDRAKAIAKQTGGDAAAVPASLARYRYPDPSQQASSKWLGGGTTGGAAKMLAQQAQFLRDQGRLQAILPGYAKFVTTEWVERALRESGRTP